MAKKPSIIIRDNHHALLAEIRKQGKTTRAELSRITGWTRPTISSIVDDLIELLYISELGLGESKGGKRPVMLSLNGDHALFGSIDISNGKTMNVIFCNLHGEVIESDVKPLKNTYDEVLAQVEEVIKKYEEKYDDRIKAYVMPVRGVLSKDGRNVVTKMRFQINDASLTQLETISDKSVYLERNAHAATYAEWRLALNMKHDLLYLSLGEGISTGFVSEGKLIRGTLMGAGEIARMPLLYKDNQYGENLNTLESIFKEELIISNLAKMTDGQVNPDQLETFFNKNDQTLNYRNFLIQNISASLFIVFNLLNIPNVVFGGRFKKFGEEFIELIHKELTKEHDHQIVEYYQKDFSIQYASCGDEIIALGACQLLVDKYLNFKFI